MPFLYFIYELLYHNYASCLVCEVCMDAIKRAIEGYVIWDFIEDYWAIPYDFQHNYVENMVKKVVAICLGIGFLILIWIVYVAYSRHKAVQYNTILCITPHVT